MNRILYSAFRLAILACAVTAVSCGSGKKEPEMKSKAAPEAAPEQALSSSFYKRLEGTIAGQPVVMYLQSYNGLIDGTYYYLSQGKPITLSGQQDETHRDRIVLKEIVTAFGAEETSASETKLAELNGVYENGTFKGSWYSADKTKSYLIDLKEAYPQGCFAFSSLHISDSLAAVQGSAGSPQATVTVDALIPLQEDAWLHAQIVRIVNDSAGHSADIAAAARASAAAFLKSYRQEVAGMDADDAAHSAVMNYEDYQHLSVVFNEHGFLAIAKNFYGYTGGAHGYGGTTYTCFDVENRKQLTLKDVLTADSAQLQPFVEAAFRKAYGFGETDSINTMLFDNHLAVTGNFFITPKGIGFLYLPYEVSSYATGEIPVFVPYADLRKYLQPAFARRMQLQ